MKGRKMTPERAKTILRAVWGAARNLDQQTAAEIEHNCHKGETLLDCLQRIAGDSFDWRKAGSFSRAAVEHFAKL